jgi:hypothetical protein
LFNLFHERQVKTIRIDDQLELAWELEADSNCLLDKLFYPEQQCSTTGNAPGSIVTYRHRVANAAEVGEWKPTNVWPRSPHFVPKDGKGNVASRRESPQR